MKWGSEINIKQLENVLEQIEREKPGTRIGTISQYYHDLQIRTAAEGGSDRVWSLTYSLSNGGWTKVGGRGVGEPGDYIAVAEMCEILSLLAKEPALPGKGNLRIVANNYSIVCSVSNPDDPFDEDYFVVEYVKTKGVWGRADRAIKHAMNFKTVLVHYGVLSLIFCWLFAMVLACCAYIPLRCILLWGKKGPTRPEELLAMRLRLWWFKIVLSAFGVLLFLETCGFSWGVVELASNKIGSFDSVAYVLLSGVSFKFFCYGLMLLVVALVVMTVLDFLMLRMARCTHGQSQESIVSG